MKPELLKTFLLWKVFVSSSLRQCEHVGEEKLCGPRIEGSALGVDVGAHDGSRVEAKPGLGSFDGMKVGLLVWIEDGPRVGCPLGSDDGVKVGSNSSFLNTNTETMKR